MNFQKINELKAYWSSSEALSILKDRAGLVVRYKHFPVLLYRTDRCAELWFPYGYYNKEIIEECNAAFSEISHELNKQLQEANTQNININNTRNL